MNMSSWDPDRPHNDLPPIPSAEVLETKPVLRACAGSRAALAGLKQVAQLIPHQSMLINTVPVLEAARKKAARKERIEAQFSAWDGKHNNLTKLIKGVDE